MLLPTQTAVKNLISARLAADVMGVPTLIVARTDANAADLITSDVDPYDAQFITGDRTPEGFFRTNAGLDQAIARGLRMLRMRILCGVKRLNRILRKPAALQKRSMRNTLANYLPITVHRPSTGKRNWMMRRLPSSRLSLGRWATSSSSSRCRLPCPEPQHV